MPATQAGRNKRSKLLLNITTWCLMCCVMLFAASAQAYDVTIVGSGASSGGAWAGDTWTASADSTVLASEVATHLANGPTTLFATNGGLHANIAVNSAVSWNANTLTLLAWGNVAVNAPMNGSGTAQLALEYGQYTTNANALSTYTINAPVSLPAGNNFSLKLGTDGSIVPYTVITGPGAAGSATATDLQGMNGNLAGNYVLGADIDASGTATWNANAGFAPVGDNSSGNATTRFTGIFEGLGHTIAGLTINSAAGYVGLFGYATGTLRDVGLTGVNITGGYQVGALVGTLGVNGTASNSFSSGTVSSGGNLVGGLVGYSVGGIITDSQSSASVSGQAAIGGLVGGNTKFFSGSSGATIVRSYATGNVTGTANDIGGLVGVNSTEGAISDSYATGAVSGGSRVGGLVGNNQTFSAIASTIVRSYSSGLVSGGADVGGLVGINDASCSVATSYWDTQTSNQAAGFGINNGAFSATGLTTANAMTQASYAGWNFGTTWWMDDTNTRPFLRREYSTRITNGHQLQMMAMDLAASYTLANNLDLTADMAGSLWGSAGFAPVGDLSVGLFTGIFDGLGHTITGLVINRPAINNIGLFGYVSTATLRNVGLVGGSVIGHNYVGHLLGGDAGGGAVISNSYATGTVSGNAVIGGLVGGLFGTITNSYASGTVSGVNGIGGLAGSSSGSIATSYSNGAVSGSGFGFGGLVAQNTGAVTSSYWDKTTSGQATSAGGTGINTVALMQTQASFTGFDFTNIWRIYDTHTTPLLKVFMTPVSAAATAAVKTYDGAAYSGGNGVTWSDPSVVAALSGSLSYGGNSQGAVNAGSYAITPGGYWSGQQGYDISYVNGNLTVSTVPLSITANNATKAYDGLAYSGGNGVSYSGFVNSEGAGVLGGTLAYGGTSQGAISAGSYVITPSGLTSGNYIITYNNGALTVMPSYTAPSATGTGNITATFTGGGAGCGYTAAQFIPLTGHAASPPTGSAPAGVSFPQGLFDFTTGGCTAGSTITLTITYPQTIPAGASYWKYGPTPGNAVPHWYVLPATIAGNTATFSITDGGLGDDDLAANGTIVDQGGPGVPGGGGTASIPTLSEWGLILLAGMLGMFGMGAMRRRAVL